MKSKIAILSLYLAVSISAFGQVGSAHKVLADCCPACCTAAQCGDDCCAGKCPADCCAKAKCSDDCCAHANQN
jgi:hypothetical protein